MNELTAAGESRVRLWDALTGQQTRCWLGHRDMVTAVAFVPDGKALVTGHDAGDDGQSAGLDWPALAAFPGTLVLYAAAGAATVELSGGDSIELPPADAVQVESAEPIAITVRSGVIAAAWITVLSPR